MSRRDRLIESHEAALKPHIADYVAIGRAAMIERQAPLVSSLPLPGMGRVVPIVADRTNTSKSAIDRKAFWRLPDRMRATCDDDVTTIILEEWESEVVGTYGTVEAMSLDARRESCALAIVDRRQRKVVHATQLRKEPSRVTTVYYGAHGEFLGGGGKSLEAQLWDEMFDYILRLGGVGWLMRRLLRGP